MSEVLDRSPLPLSPAQIREQDRAQWLGVQAVPFPKERFIDDTGNWQDLSACKGRDTEIFFPPPGDKNARMAKGICYGCVVRNECLEEALEKGIDFGIWGGKTEYERRKLQRRR